MLELDLHAAAELLHIERRGVGRQSDPLRDDDGLFRREVLRLGVIVRLLLVPSIATITRDLVIHLSHAGHPLARPSAWRPLSIHVSDAPAP